MGEFKLPLELNIQILTSPPFPLAPSPYAPVVEIFHPIQLLLIQCSALSRHDSEGSCPEDKNKSYSKQT